MLGELVPCGGGDPIPLLKSKLMIGRRNSCDISLRFPNVSSHHCQLEMLNGYWFVRDLNSRNGIKVNGMRCDSKWLMPGDVLSVAKHRYEMAYAPQTDAPPPEDEDPFSVSLLEKAGLLTRGDTEAASASRPGSASEPSKPAAGNGSDDDDFPLECSPRKTTKSNPEPRPTVTDVSKKKRRKVRVAFRKNRQKKARKTDITREALDEGIEAGEFDSHERVGKDELTRYRTVMGVESDEGEGLVRDVDVSRCLTGRVQSAIGLNALVQTPDGRRFECTVRRVVRTMARDERNAVVTGDEVLFQPIDGETGVIERVEPRRHTLSREVQSREHIIVANVDQALIVVSAAEPALKANLVDRMLISAEKGQVHAIICINKIDLVDPVALQPIAGLYGRLGYDVVLASAAQSAGIGRLKQLMRDRETVVAGQSGVGKSSLLNAIQPGLDLQIGQVSHWTKKGRHTTRRAVLLELDFGGWVADTPGIRQFELWDVPPEEVEVYFIEFRPFVTRCKFPDCSHTHEFECGVKQAVLDDLIAPSRYESYLRIVEGD